jgi:Ulp1 family protease
MMQYVLFPVNIHFHWNLFIFEFLTIFLIFILVAILKILITKSTTLSDDLFLCQVSKGSAVRFEFNIFCTLVTMATIAILNFFNPQKLPHTTVDILSKFHED